VNRAHRRGEQEAVDQDISTVGSRLAAISKRVDVTQDTLDRAGKMATALGYRSATGSSGVPIGRAESKNDGLNGSLIAARESGASS